MSLFNSINSIKFYIVFCFIVFSNNHRVKSWRFGFQCLAILVFSTFFLAILYRPASLYHPQRRAILHLKSLQKRSRMKDAKQQAHQNHHPKTQAQASVGSGTSSVTGIDKPAYFDISVLRSRTIQILLGGTSISSLGISAPLFLLVRKLFFGHTYQLFTKSRLAVTLALSARSIRTIINVLSDATSFASFVDTSVSLSSHTHFTHY